jgi:pimeloyl-ACP methyl ester carboxylesterase
MASTLDPSVLPSGITSHIAPGINGLDMHYLAAGDPKRPLILLLHGFPELAYSWRHVMVPLAQAGFRVIAPDQRGYGRTTGWDGRYDGNLASYRFLNLVRDALGLVFALGHRTVHTLVGHDFGASVASWAALTRPDIFRSLVLMSAPFSGPPAIPFDTLAKPTVPSGPTIHEAMAALARPRKHYQWYYSTPEANANMWRAKQGLHDFLRAYYHHKSADWKANKPFELSGWTAEEVAKMPTYYIMDLADGMAETVAKEMPSPAEIAAATWLPEAELRVYSGEYERTGFQGGLNWYRVRTSGTETGELEIFTGRTIDVPAMFIAGASDWGIRQSPGALGRMQKVACPQMKQVHLVEGAGHWVQQEKPKMVSALLGEFANSIQSSQ